jgi:hypothetical protein
MEDKQLAIYKDLLDRYSSYLCEECHLLSPIAKVWVAKKLARIKNLLSILYLNYLEVGSLPISYIYANFADHINSLSKI